MTQPPIAALLWFSAMGCGLMSGVYFVFSTVIMRALTNIAPSSAIAAMTSIDHFIVRSLFIPVFFATTLGALALAIFGITRWGQTGSIAMLAGGTIYVVGMFVVTVAFNVPLNNALVATDPSSAEAGVVWARYAAEWTPWNHVRAIASLAASALFVHALNAR